MDRSQKYLLTCFVITTLYLARVESCNTNEFQCTNGECIPTGGRCDVSFDCQDRSDENNCQGVQPCPEGRHRCDTGECVTDRNLCPTLTTIIELSTSNVESSTQNLKEITPTNTFQKQSSSSYVSSKYDIQPTATHSMPDSSEAIDTTPLVKAVTTPTDDHDPHSESNNILYLLLLLLLIPICCFAYYIWKRLRKSDN